MRGREDEREGGRGNDRVRGRESVFITYDMESLAL